MQASNADAWSSTTSPFGNVEGIHLKSRRIEDGTLYAEGRGRGSKLKKKEFKHGRRGLHHRLDRFFHSLRAVRCSARQDLNMDILVGCIGVVLIVYLFVSVIRPEKF
jgi:K+-transporting ATPase KdpF subunit